MTNLKTSGLDRDSLVSELQSKFETKEIDVEEAKRILTKAGTDKTIHPKAIEIALASIEYCEFMRKITYMDGTLYIGDKIPKKLF